MAQEGAGMKAEERRTSDIFCLSLFGSCFTLGIGFPEPHDANEALSALLPANYAAGASIFGAAHAHIAVHVTCA